MEWEEALLRAWGDDGEPSSYFRRQAKRTREIAEEVTTRAVRARLLDEARHYDALAAQVNDASTET